MRARVALAGLGIAAIVAVAVVATPAVAYAKEKPSEVSKCVENAVKTGQQADTCIKSPNPILPAGNELLWGSISFVVLVFLLYRFAWPGIKQGMEGRTERIRSSIDEAEQAKNEARGILEEYQRQLNDAKSEAARIIEEARQAADKLRQDLKRQAESEVNDQKQRAQEDINAMVDRARADLQASVRSVTIELAEKVVERNLDRDTNLALIDNLIAQMETAR